MNQEGDAKFISPTIFNDQVNLVEYTKNPNTDKEEIIIPKLTITPTQVGNKMILFNKNYDTNPYICGFVSNTSNFFTPNSGKMIITTGELELTSNRLSQIYSGSYSTSYIELLPDTKVVTSEILVYIDLIFEIFIN